MIIDTHSHVNFNVYKNDADEVIRRSLVSDTWMIVVGTDYKSSTKAIELANKYEKGVYVTVGLHPTSFLFSGDEADFSDKEMFNIQAYEKLAKFDKVVAVGEIGLDYYHLEKDEKLKERKQEQAEIFFKQLLLATDNGLPAVIHCRDAHKDMISILTDFKKTYKDRLATNKPWAVIHCFSGNEEQAWKYFNLGVIISFTGLITFNSQWEELIRKMPMDKFLVETDAPFMTPVPNRGKRNEPEYVKYVVEKIAKIKDVPVKRIEEAARDNTKRIFGI